MWNTMSATCGTDARRHVAPGHDHADPIRFELHRMTNDKTLGFHFAENIRSKKSSGVAHNTGTPDHGLAGNLVVR
jgi:hypothetical protein